MVDEALKVWLLEVNSNPFLGTQSPRHGALVSRMIEDAHRIAVDTVFPPRGGGGGGGEPNGFRLLYTERTQDELQLDVTGCAWPPVFEREVVGGVPTIKRSAADVERLARAPFDSGR